MNIADAKGAVRAVLNFFGDSGIDPDAEDVRVEELALSDDETTWEVTLGYLRPRQVTHPALIAGIGRDNRVYKTFSVRKEDGEVTGMRIRELANAG